MLSELRVRDLAVIADVTLPLGPGLNVLTGETGAGKSILVDALALLLGERASGELVRPGASKAKVEAAFDVGDSTFFRQTADEAGVELDDGRFIAKREIHREGRNRAWANGSPTTVGVLTTLGRLLVDLHGQHESQSLLRPGTQRDLLDAYADALGLREQVLDAFTTLQKLSVKENELVTRRDDVRKRADYLKHVLDEIEATAPVDGEDEALSTEINRLSNATELTNLAEAVVRELDGDEQSVSHNLNTVQRTLTQLERLDDSVSQWRTRVDELITQVVDLALELRSYASEIDVDPARLGEAEARRDTLYDLMRKYGSTIAAVLDTGREAGEELELLDTADLDLANIAERRTEADITLRKLAASLTDKRRAAASELASAVDDMLPALGMPDGKLVPIIGPLDDPGPTGQDAVSFHVQLNQGMEAKPLAQVASGGELSRIMLALKVVLAQHDKVPTLIFDEVDSGVGGEVGNHLADALAAAARTSQVLVITHLPQVAARAERHITVTKGVKAGVAATNVTVLDTETRIAELARMMGDLNDPVLQQHARELLSGASPVP